MLPKVSCICPTRGRFESLRESISFFILQDYPNKELIIFNNHPTPIQPHPKLRKHNIFVINGGDYSDKSIQLVYNDCLNHVSSDSEYIAIWDDDDMYFPWHLSSNVKKLLDSQKKAIRSDIGYWEDINNQLGRFVLIKNNLEASMIVEKDEICFNLNVLDKKSDEYTHPHIMWNSKLKNDFAVNNEITAIFRWNYGRNYAHLQSVGPHKNTVDDGKKEILKPKPIKNLYFNFLENANFNVNNGKITQFSNENKSSFLKRILNYNLEQFEHVDKYNVWLYWNDEKNTPRFIKECFKSITGNTFTNCVILNDNSLKEYVLPNYFWNLNPVEKSDFIRIYFLYKYGGWWFDADTFIIGDLDKHYFNYLNLNESVFPSEYNIPQTMTTPMFSSKPNGEIVKRAYENQHKFLRSLKPPYNLGWAKLGFVGIIESFDFFKERENWNYYNIHNIVKWYYNNGNIEKWKFDDIQNNELQIYLLHWTQIGAEMSKKINLEPNGDISLIVKRYPNLEQLFKKSEEGYF